MASPASSKLSPVAFLINLAALGIFGYSVYYINFDKNMSGMNDLMPAALRPYGMIKYLTYQCLLMQFANAILHFLAHFISPLKGLRDLVFTTLAYPTGSLVVYSFWAVWYSFGRELIFPLAVEKFYPSWLNHATHTVIAPINILMAVLVQHKYTRNGVALTILHSACYTGFLFYIKHKSGHFVYGFLEVMSDSVRTGYFVVTGILCYLLYKSGQYLTSICHPNVSQRASPSGSKKHKQN